MGQLMELFEISVLEARTAEIDFPDALVDATSQHSREDRCPEPWHVVINGCSATCGLDRANDGLFATSFDQWLANQRKQYGYDRQQNEHSSQAELSAETTFAFRLLDWVSGHLVVIAF